MMRALYRTGVACSSRGRLLVGTRTTSSGCACFSTQNNGTNTPQKTSPQQQKKEEELVERREKELPQEMSSPIPPRKEAKWEQYQSDTVHPVTSADFEHKGDQNTVSMDWARLNDQKEPIDLEFARELPEANELGGNFRGRKAIIQRPGRHPMSSRPDRSRHWVIQFDSVNNWGNGLMAWTSTNDAQDQLRQYLRFENREQAIYFCERNGWDWEVDEDVPQSPGDRINNSYDQNFVPRDIRYQLDTKGPRKGRYMFQNKNMNKSCWMNLKRSKYGNEEWKRKTKDPSKPW